MGLVNENGWVVDIDEKCQKLLIDLKVARQDIDSQYRDALRRLAVENAYAVERALRLAGVKEDVEYSVSEDCKTITTRPKDIDE